MKEYDMKVKYKINIIYIYGFYKENLSTTNDTYPMKNSCSNDLFTYVTSCCSTMRK